jgi:hypothetical protein
MASTKCGRDNHLGIHDEQLQNKSDRRSVFWYGIASYVGAFAQDPDGLGCSFGHLVR